MHLEFLSTNSHFLDSAAKAIMKCYRQGSVLDLEKVLLVSSSSRFNRRLLRKLCAMAKEEGLLIEAGEVITLGALPDALGLKRVRVAEAKEQLLAWHRSIEQADEAMLAKYFGAELSEKSIKSLAKHMLRLESEIAPYHFSLRDIPDSFFNDVSGFEEQRWQFFKSLHATYLEELKEKALTCPEQYVKQAIADKVFSSSLDVVLCNVIDITPRLLRILSQVEGKVSHLIFASEKASAGFNENGVLQTSFWKDVQLDILPGHLKTLQHRSEQAEFALELLSKNESSATITYAEPYTATLLKAACKQKNLDFTLAFSEDLSKSLIASCCKAIKGYNERASIHTLLTLLLLPPVSRLILKKLGNYCQSLSELLEALDTYQQRHLQDDFSKPCIHLAALLQRTVSIVNETFLWKESKTWNEWQGMLSSLFEELFVDVKLEAQHVVALEAIAQELLSFTPLSESFTDKKYAAHFPLDFLIERLRQEQYYTDISPSGLHIMGNLEALLDDSETLIICDANEGCMPEAVDSNWLLPEAAKVVLGLPTNERRLAREIYFSHCFLASKKTLTYLVPKISNEEELQPSRVLYNSKDSNFIGNVTKLFSPIVSGGIDAVGDDTLVSMLPEVSGEGGYSEMTVTSFRSYLRCPFRYYVSHVLKLRQKEDLPRELTPLHFGNILHDILHGFALSKVKDSSSSQVIDEYLQDALHSYLAKRFGLNALPAIAIQEEVLRKRLSVFAAFQAQRRKAGWRIESSERQFDGVALQHDSGITKLRARIDRIDRHEKDNKVSIIDYKTSDVAIAPAAAHTYKGEWHDLQLPLYHYLLRAGGECADIELAYTSLSADQFKGLYQKASWSEDEIEGAIEVARDVASHVYQGHFDPSEEIAEGSDILSFMIQEAL